MNKLGKLYPAPFVVTRFHVPEDKVNWNVGFKEYKPSDYTAEKVLANPPWADPESVQGLKFNEVDGPINRISYEGKYQISPENGRPLNPIGRTGIAGRGVLGKWGPNHAADCIVTRRKLGESGTGTSTFTKQGKPVWEFIAIQRKDTGQYALPGGMVDPGETVHEAAQREFLEEVMDSDSLSGDSLEQLTKNLEPLFRTGKEIYKGYVVDHRNTDNAWMETLAIHYESSDDIHKKYLHHLIGGSDASSAQWLELSQDLPMYASHSVILKKLAQEYGISW